MEKLSRERMEEIRNFWFGYSGEITGATFEADLYNHALALESEIAEKDAEIVRLNADKDELHKAIEKENVRVSEMIAQKDARIAELQGKLERAGHSRDHENPPPPPPPGYDKVRGKGDRFIKG